MPTRWDWGWRLPWPSTLVVRVAVVNATIDASAAGTCWPVIVNAGAGMAAVAVDTGDDAHCSCQCQGWGLLQSSTLELGAGHDRQRWGLSQPSTLGVSMAAVVVDAGDGGSTIITNSGAVRKKNSLDGVGMPVVGGC